MTRLNSNLHPQLTSKLIKCLNNVDIFTVYDFVSFDNDQLMNSTQLPYKILLDIKQKLTKQFSGKIENPLELLEKQNEYFSTGIQSLDDLLENGIYSTEIYEICGQSSAGKSQLCLSIAVNVAINYSGIIYYLDSNNNFSSSRVQMILESLNADDEQTAKVMNKLKVINVKNTNELLNELYNLTSVVNESKDNKKIKLIIIDSLVELCSMFENKYIGYFFNNLSNIMKYLSNEFSIPIIVTNLIQYWRENDTKNFILKPSLSISWSHIPNVRLYIEKFDNKIRNIILWKSNRSKIKSSIQVEIVDAGFIAKN